MPSYAFALFPRRTLALWLASASLLSACSIAPPAPPAAPADTQAWSGRMGLQIHDPNASEQSFSASFHLQGSAERGRLDVYNPLGSQIARLHWSPGTALLEQGNNAVTSDSLQALLQRSLGSALPVGAMFDWLQGRATPTPGWQVDLSRQADGRITAHRTAPPPEATLRLILQTSPP